MANFVIGKCMNLIKINKPELSQTDLEIIQYGLHGLYLSLTKIFVLIIVSCLLGQLKEYLILAILFGILRTNAFGMHAKKSWMCWITTVPTFIILPYITQHLIIPNIIKLILGFILILHIYKFSPADTHKKPIIDKNLRKKHKLLATLTAIIYVISSILIKEQMICNSLIFSLFLANILISPITYKIFNLPYNNYLKYTKDSYGRKEKVC